MREGSPSATRSRLVLEAPRASSTPHRKPSRTSTCGNTPPWSASPIALSGSRWGAEDLAQEAFLAAHRDWGRIGSYQQPAAWVRRVVANLAVSAFRRRVAETKALARIALGRGEAADGSRGSRSRVLGRRPSAPATSGASGGALLPRGSVRGGRCGDLEHDARHREATPVRRTSDAGAAPGGSGGGGMTLDARGRTAGRAFRGEIERMRTTGADRASIERFERFRAGRQRRQRIGTGLLAAAVAVAAIAVVVRAFDAAERNHTRRARTCRAAASSTETGMRTCNERTGTPCDRTAPSRATST